MQLPFTQSQSIIQPFFTALSAILGKNASLHNNKCKLTAIFAIGVGFLVRFWANQGTHELNIEVDAKLTLFLASVIGITLLPGATTLLIIRRALFDGKRASRSTILGGSLSIVAHALIAALGLAVIFQHSSHFQNMTRIIGAVYLAWLGVKSIKQRESFEFTPSMQSSQTNTHRGAFIEGFTTMMLSPQVALFYLSALSQFIAPHEWLLGKALLLAAIHVVIRQVWFSVLASFVNRIIAVLTRPMIQRSIEVISGCVLFGLAINTLSGVI